jgi:hypothetical protein
MVMNKLKIAFNILFRNWKYKEYWDIPNGCCSQCGAPLNSHLIGGYRLHDGKYSVSAWCNAKDKELVKAATEMLNNQ